MFDPADERETGAPAKEAGRAGPRRAGLPLDPRRILHVIVARRRWLLGAALLAATVGVVLGKWVVPKSYVASSTVLWEPPELARADAVRQLSTLAQSVKLPENMRAVREKTGIEAKLEVLASRIDVRLGDNSMLITVAAKAKTSEESAQLANTVVEVFLEAQREIEAARLRAIAQALRDSLKQAEVEVTRARSAYGTFREANKITDLSVEAQAAIEELARLRVAANDAKVELESLRAQEASLRLSRDASPGEVESSRSEQDPTRARLAAAQADLAQMRAKFTSDHPKVRALEAEVAALEAEVATARPAVTSRVITRGPVRDDLSTKVEQLSALRKSIEQRKITLDEVLATSEKRASELTSAQAEAARLLADVRVSEEHAAKLLEQIASAEDDVRKVSSGFQVVSRAAPPVWPERSMGRIVAAAVPVFAVLLILLGLVIRELLPLRGRGACEVAYFTSAPVLWATCWPQGSDEDRHMLSRELADAIESRGGVVGIAGLADNDDAHEIAALVADRMVRRGVPCAMTDERARANDAADMTLADALEHQSLGIELAALQTESERVLVVLPPLSQMSAVRAGKRWLDALVLVIPSGEVSAGRLLALRSSLGIEGRGLGIVVIRSPEWLLSSGTRTFGNAAELWGLAQAARQHLTPPPGPVSS